MAIYRHLVLLTRALNRTQHALCFFVISFLSSDTLDSVSSDNIVALTPKRKFEFRIPNQLIARQSISTINQCQLSTAGMSLCVQSYCQHFAYTLRAWFLYHCFVFVYVSVLVCLYPYVFNDVLPVPRCFSAIKISAIKSLCLYSSSVAIIEFNTQTCWNTDMAKWLRILQPILSSIQSMAYQYQWQCHSPATASRCIVPNQM